MKSGSRDSTNAAARACKHCAEYAELSRRGFLAGAAGAAGAAAWLAAPLPAGTPRLRLGNPARDVLVNVFLRGGMDGLTTVVPHGDGELYKARQNLAIAPPGQPDGALDLDGFFGLPPSAAPLLTPWADDNIVFVHAAGSPNDNRSHFTTQDLWERGIDDETSGIPSGWLARHLLDTAAVDPAAPMRAMAADAFLAKALALAPNALAVPDAANFGLQGAPATEAARVQAFQTMYAEEPPPLGPAALNTFDTITLLETIDFENYVPQNGAVYPETPYGQTFLKIAAVIKADIGLEVAEADLGGWDLHNQLGPIAGDMAALLDELTASLEAFYLDLGTGMDDVTVLVQSEFGRRIEENSSLGLDHGQGNVILVLGANVNGGQVFTNGAWPGLDNPTVNGDLQVTTDFRDVLGEILAKRMGNTDLTNVFPGHTVTFHGLLNP